MDDPDERYEEIKRTIRELEEDPGNKEETEELWELAIRLKWKIREEGKENE